MEKFELKNGIESVYRLNKNTPRVGLTLNVAINKPEKYAGTYSLMNRLFLQGTKTRSAEDLANELDANAIEFTCEMKQDYLRFRFVCLNEDFENSVKIMADCIKNSTFDNFEKEKTKMYGEIVADLDSARTKAVDNFLKNIFKDHYYGNTCTKILENIDNIEKNDVVEAYNSIMNNSKKILAVVGDLEFDYVQSILEKYLGDLPNSINGKEEISGVNIDEQKYCEVIKDDAQQAQIYQGWIVPDSNSPDYPALVIFNTILGACGLSSRLFTELRDKKGLAYTVRSSYDIYKTCGCFNIYIATEPNNIQTSLKGFLEEIQKLKDVEVSEKELENAKNNVLGKQQFVTETNAQQANQLAYYGIMDHGFEYQDLIIDKIKKVKTKDIQSVAQKYFDDKYLVAILKP